MNTCARRSLLALAAVLLMSGCTITPSFVSYDEKVPEAVVDRFVQALQDDRPQDAYPLLTEERRANVTPQAFAAGVHQIAAGDGAITGHKVTGSRFTGQRPLRVSVRVSFTYRNSAPAPDVGVATIRDREGRWLVDIGA